jgi:hypothetical protein
MIPSIGGSLHHFVGIKCAVFVVVDANGIEEDRWGRARIVPEDAPAMTMARRGGWGAAAAAAAGGWVMMG